MLPNGEQGREGGRREWQGGHRRLSRQMRGTQASFCRWGLGWTEKDSENILGGCSINKRVALGMKCGGVGE